MNISDVPAHGFLLILVQVRAFVNAPQQFVVQGVSMTRANCFPRFTTAFTRVNRALFRTILLLQFLERLGGFLGYFFREQFGENLSRIPSQIGHGEKREGRGK